MQYACTILSSVACLTVPYFFHITSQTARFEKYIEHNISVLVFSATFVWRIFHSKKNSGRYYHKCTCEVSVISQILMKTEFSRQIFEKYSNIKFRENSSVGAQLFHADGQADMTKLIIAFRNSANAPKKEGRKEERKEGRKEKDIT